MEKNRGLKVAKTCRLIIAFVMLLLMVFPYFPLAPDAIDMWWRTDVMKLLLYLLWVVCEIIAWYDKDNKIYKSKRSIYVRICIFALFIFVGVYFFVTASGKIMLMITGVVYVLTSISCIARDVICLKKM